MRVCACFLLVGIFVYTHCSAPNPPLDNKRSVNLALETVLEFNERDKASDIKFLDNVQNFITKVKTVIGKNSNVKTDFRRDYKAPAVDTFTDFLQEVVNILNTFDNTTLIDFFENLDIEVRKYHYRGCKFYELTENNDIRKLIAAKLDLMRRTPASVMKTNINKLSETLNDDKNIKEVFNYINSLYRQDSRGKFQKVLSELELYGRSNSQSNTRLRDIIKNGVRSIIFDHYTNLNTNVRRDVKQKMENFWKQFNKNHPSNNIANARASNNNMNEVKSLKPVSRKLNNNGEVKQSDPINVATKRDDVKRDNKRKKRTRKDTIDGPANVQDMGKRVPSPQQTGATNQQETKIERQQQSSSLSSESLEMYHRSKKDTQQNKAMHSKQMSLKKTLMKSRKKSEKIEVVSPTTRNPTHNTVPNIWIEESTGRLPKEVLDRLSMKARGHNTTKHAPGRNKENDIGRKSWHGKMYKLKHDTKRMKKYRSKYDSQYESVQGVRQKASGNNKLVTIKSSKPDNLKLHQYKKSMRSMTVESHKTDRSSPDTSKTMEFLDSLNVHKIPAKTVKSPRRTVTKKRTAHSKTKRIKYGEVRRMKATPRTSTDLTAQKQLSTKKRKSEKHFENNFDYPSPSSDDMIGDQIKIKNDKATEYQSGQKINNLEKDIDLIRKIKNLEKEIDEVRSKVNGKAGDKLSEQKETKKMRSFSETKTGSDVNNDPKIDKIETLGTVDNKAKPMFILTNKDVIKYNDVKANSENGARNNADVVKVTELQQSIEPNKEIRKISKAKPFVNRSFIDSIPRQDKLQITETSNSKNGSVIPNQYVQNLVSKYKKAMESFENAQSKTNVNAHVDKVKENISDFAVTGTAKTTKEVLIDSVKDKGSIVDGKKAVPFFRSETNIISNNFMARKDNAEVTSAADYQKDIIEKDKYSKNNKTQFNIDKVKSRPKTKQISHFESVRDGLLDMTKIANNKKESFDKTVSVSDFKSIDKDKRPESIFRSDVKLITNDFKDKTEVAKVTRTADRNTDTNKKSIFFKNNESIFRSNVNLTTNDYKDKTEIVKLARTADKNTDVNKKYKKFKNNEIKGIIQSRSNVDADLKGAGAVNKTEFFEGVGFNYNKLSEIEPKKYLRTDASHEREIEYTYPPLRDGQLAYQGLVTISAPKETMFKDLDQMNKNILTKNKYNKPLKVSELDIKVNNIYQGVKSVTSRGSDVNKTSINVLDRTENTKVIEKADSKTAIIENRSFDTKGKTVGNDYQTITVTKKQSPIIKEDNKTEVTLNIVVVTPEAKHGGAVMKYRAVDDASIGAVGAVAVNTKIKSTNTPTKPTESTSSAAMKAVTTPTTLKLSTMEVILPSIRSQTWRTSNSGFRGK